MAAGLCHRPAEWRWSSYRALIGRARQRAFVDPSTVLDLFHHDRTIATRLLRDFVEAAA